MVNSRVQEIREKDIIHFLKNQPRECSTSEIGGMLGMNHFTALRYLISLEKKGKLIKTAQEDSRRIYWKLR